MPYSYETSAPFPTVGTCTVGRLARAILLRLQELTAASCAAPKGSTERHAASHQHDIPAPPPSRVRLRSLQSSSKDLQMTRSSIHTSESTEFSAEILTCSTKSLETAMYGRSVTVRPRSGRS